MANFFTPEKFDWSKFIVLPEVKGKTNKGHQIFNLSTTDNDYRESSKAKEFVQKYLKNATLLNSDAETLKYGSGSCDCEWRIYRIGSMYR